MRRLAVAFVVLLAFFAVSALHAYRAWSPGAPTYAAERVRAVALAHRLRSSEEHDAALARTGDPYVLEIEADAGALLYYGARHFDDPEDPQAADIRKRWDAFEPTVALCEGRRRGYFLGQPFQALGGLSEPAIVHALARRDGVRLFSLEPDYEDEVAALLETWTPEEVALYFTMRVYWSESEGESDEDLALHLLGKRTDVEGLRGSLASIADIDRVWRRDFPGLDDWRSLGHEPDAPYLSDISHASRRVRGEHMARILIDLVHAGERVLAVVGSGHVIRQEWALRAALGAPPAFDQPEADSGAGDR